MRKQYFENDVVNPIPKEFTEVCRAITDDDEGERFVLFCEQLEKDGQNIYEILKSKNSLSDRLKYIRDAMKAMAV